MKKRQVLIEAAIASNTDTVGRFDVTATLDASSQQHTKAALMVQRAAIWARTTDPRLKQ